MSKNVFVATGSTAVNGLIQLLKRLKADGVYGLKKDDIFIGIDSDIGRLTTLKNIDTVSNPARIFTVQMTLRSDSPEKKVVGAIESQWQTLGQIPTDGVGGDRRLSYTSLNWTVFWDIAKLNSELKSDDRVILLGSAFGGTSTGSFWNIAEFIQHQIRAIELRTNGNLGAIKFYSMLVLPEKNPQTNYPLGRNFCAFLQDMQLIDWRRLLDEKMNADDFHFRVPVYSRWDKQSPDRLPVFNTVEDCCAATSNLPMEELFLLPTPENAQEQTKLYFAELAFVLFYMNLADRVPSTTIDFFKTMSDPQPFAGFNMIVARNASNAVLKARFYELLSMNWNIFWNGDLTDDDDLIMQVRRIIHSAITQNDTVSTLDDAKEKIKNEIKNTGKLSELSKDFPDHLRAFGETTCDKTPYHWMSLPELLDKVMENKDKDLPLDKMALAAVAKAYRQEYDYMKALAEQADVKYENDQILTSISNQLQKAERLFRIRGNSKIAKLVNGASGARQEISNEIRNYLYQAVEDFVEAHRAAATLALMPEPVDIEELRREDEYQRAAKLLEAHIQAAKAPQKSNIKGFIFEDIDTQSQLSINSIPGISFTKMFLEALTAADESALQTVIQKYETLGVDILREEAEKLQNNNPLKHLKTKIPTDELHSYAQEVFSISQTGKGLMHFCYTCGPLNNVEWPTWGKLKGELGFSSFGMFPRTGADDNKANLYDSSIQGPGDNSWFCENHVSDHFKNMQGVWLGTLDLTRSLKDILKATFRGAPVEKWETLTWKAAEEKGGDKPRLMSLRTMVYLGLTMGAIEKKIIDVTGLTKSNFNQIRLNLAVRSKKGKDILLCRNVMPVDLGFSSEHLRFGEIKLDWITNLVKWFNDVDAGFVQDFKLDRASLDGELLFERLIINDCRMQIPPEMLQKMETLFTQIYDFVEIEKI